MSVQYDGKGQLISSSGGTGANGDDRVTDLDSFINSILNALEKWGKFLGVPQGIFKVGGLGGLNDLKSVALIKADATGPGLAHFDAKGGVLVNTLAEGLQVASVKDFSRISIPPIEGIPIQAGEPISMASLGTFSPPSIGASMGGMEMGVG